MICQTSFILLFMLFNNIIANNRNRNGLTKRTIVDHRKPLPPKKLPQHAYYYSIKNAVDNKISYHDSYNYLYRQNNKYYNKY